MQFIPVPTEGFEKMSVSELEKYRDNLLALKDDVSNDEYLFHTVPQISDEIKRAEIEIMWKNKERGIDGLN